MCRSVLRMKFIALIALIFACVGVSCSSQSKSQENTDLKRSPGSDGISADVTSQVTIDKLSSELSISPQVLIENTKLLAQYLENEEEFEDLCSEDQSQDREVVCSFIGEIKEGEPEESVRRKRERPVRLDIKNLDTNQSLPYFKAARAVARTNKSKVTSWVPTLLAHNDCPRNLSAAALRKLEESLPDKKIMEQIEALYDHASSCLKPSDDGYEIVHFRQGLLRRMYGDNSGALKAIQLAAKAENPQERGRTLYWLGILSDDKKAKKSAWDELTTKQPLTYHSLMVWKTQNEDPFGKFSKSSSHTPIARATRKLSGRMKTSVQWLEALYLFKYPLAAERLTRWISSQEGDLPAEAIIYLGALKNSHDQHHNAIKFLTETVVKNPELLNEAMLKELYPIPYLEIFDRYSQRVDTFLVMGLARQESAFNPNARSPAKAQGVMQVLPRVARRKLHTHKVDLYDVETNVRVGSKLLREWIGRFGEVEYALIAYNAGPLRVNEWKKRYPTEDMTLFLDLIPFKETRNYVGSVIRNNYWYHRLYENDPNYKALKLQHPENQEGQKYYSQIVRDMISAHTDLKN